MFMITNSAVFKEFNLKPMVVDIVLENAPTKRIKPSQLGMGYIMLKESKIFRKQLTHIITMCENDTIQLFYDPTYPNIAPFIPFESTKIRGKMCVAVNIAHHINKNGVEDDLDAGNTVVKYDISTDKLRALLFGAAAVLCSSTTDGFRHMAVARDAQIVFMANMWMKALSRISTIATNPENAGHFKYCMSKWLCCSMYAITDDEMTTGIATKVSMVRNHDRARAFNLKYTDEELRSYDVSDFIQKVLHEEFPQLKKLDLATVRHGFTNMGTINVMCVDYLPYVTAAIIGYETDFLLYGNKYLYNELRTEIKEALIGTSMVFEKRLAYFASL